MPGAEAVQKCPWNRHVEVPVIELCQWCALAVPLAANAQRPGPAPALLPSRERPSADVSSELVEQMAEAEATKTVWVGAVAMEMVTVTSLG